MRVLNLRKEHAPWVPADYSAGLNGQRTAICGYSHYADEVDSADLTIRVIRNVSSGQKIRFFTSIAKAFGMTPGALFERVAFLNFMPWAIGKSDKRYAVGSDEEVERGLLRFKQFVAEHNPDRIFVFSSKAWSPIAHDNKRWDSLLDDPINWSSYTRLSARCIVIGTRHPQGARAAHLAKVVRLGLALSVNE